MPTKVSTKINVSVLTGVILAGAMMFALAGFGFLKTEIEPTIKNNLPGWAWSFQTPDNYSFDNSKIKIENSVVELQQGIEQGEIKNNYPYSYGCLPNPAVAFITDSDGEISYQISKDNLNWYYWNSGSWKNATNIDQANTATEVNQHIVDFYPLSLNQFYFNAILNKKDSRLRGIQITCDESTLKKVELYPKSL
ncbi:MAG: hypothetical protein WC663_00815 [Patescibacteria group bacterium]|jgi:hypothetical protein